MFQAPDGCARWTRRRSRRPSGRRGVLGNERQRPVAGRSSPPEKTREAAAPTAAPRRSLSGGEITTETASASGPASPTATFRARDFDLACHRGLGCGSCSCTAVELGSGCPDRDHHRPHRLYGRSPPALSPSGHRTRS